MRQISSVLIFLLLLSSCKNKVSSPSKQIEVKNVDTSKVLFVHLKDSIVIQGECVLFLHPSDERWEYYEKLYENDPRNGGMYEVDSDNGFGLSETYDSLKADKKYKNIKWDNSDKRYVVIKDCMNGPKIIDRDTSDYGIIMTSKGREIMMDNHIHLGDSYLQLIKEYFRL